MTVEATLIYASLVSAVVAQPTLISASPKETGLDQKELKAPAVKSSSEVISRGETEVILKALYSSVRHPKPFSPQTVWRLSLYQTLQ